MANWWSGHGRDVTIFTLDDQSATPFYQLERTVQRLGLGLVSESSGALSAIRNNVGRLLGLRRVLRERENCTVVSFGTETNCLVLLASMGLGQRVLVSERCDPKFVPDRRVWRILRRLLYPIASAVVVQTQAARTFFSRNSRVAVIHNPVIASESAYDRSPVVHDDALSKRPFMLAIGRLARQKGFDLLISAFGEIAVSHPEWSLLILGEGKERQALEDQISRLDLAHRVRLPGVVPEPVRIYRQADLFVLSSRFEGFPNVLCEAMACGLPVISTDCPSGPGEIICNGVDGVLVPPEDVEQLAQAMSRLMTDGHMRRALGARASKISNRLHVDTIMAQWNSVVEELAPA